MRYSFAIAILALAALGAIPALAQEIRQTPGSNVSVTACSAHRHAIGFIGHPWIDPYGTYHPAQPFPHAVGFLNVAYTNEKAVAATEIDFGLVARGSLIAVTKDVGTFAPGAKIDHEFSLDPEVFPIGTALPYCAVLHVKYADGTQWSNPSPPT